MNNAQILSDNCKMSLYSIVDIQDQINDNANKQLFVSSNEKFILISHDQYIVKRDDNIVQRIKDKLQEESKYVVKTFESNNSEAINDSFVVLLILTKDYCEENQLECQEIYAKNKTVIVVKIEADFGFENANLLIQERIRGCRFIDFSKPESFNERFCDLLDEIKRENDSQRVQKQSEFRLKTTKVNYDQSNVFRYCGIIAPATIAFTGLILILICGILNSMFYHMKPKCVKSDKEITGRRPDYRYSLKISMYDYVYYGGQKTWFLEDESTQEKFIEMERNDESVIVSASYEKIILSSLCKLDSPNQLVPKWYEAHWENVWGSNDGNTFIYPKKENLWLKLQNDEISATLQFVSKSGETVFFDNNRDRHSIKLNNSGMFDYFQDGRLMFVTTGKWIHFND